MGGNKRRTLTVRFDEGMYELVKARAEDGNRSMNRQIMQDLRSAEKERETKNDNSNRSDDDAGGHYAHRLGNLVVG